MAEEDFEIDFYGEGNEQQQQQQQQPANAEEDHRDDPQQNQHDEKHDEKRDDDDHMADHAEADKHHDDHDHDPNRNADRQNHDDGKPRDDGRPVDPGATTALMISELNWWTTDDDIRGWLRDGDCEKGVKDLTFSEHKVNGKSKGQIYIEFQSMQDATAAKHMIDQMPADGGHLGQKKITTSFWNAAMNPFRTLPKDAPARAKDQQTRTPSTSYNDRGGYNSGGYRGGRGNFGGGGRGGMNQNNFNRNFGNNNMGYNNHQGGGFNGPPGGNFGYGGRGGMMGGGMRGGGMRGRGGMMGMNPMGGGMPMGMPNMGMGMMPQGGMQGFQGGMNFNGGFGYGQNQGDWGNPHGAKRQRPE